MNESSPYVVGISGKIGSGKTELATALSKFLNTQQTSFGAIVRLEARARGLNEFSREILQAVGQELVEADMKLFCQKVLDYACFDGKMSLIVDGIRHLKVKETLAALVLPIPFYLLYVEAEDSVRSERLTRRGGLSNLNIMHPTEQDVFGSLKEVADLHVNNNGSIIESVRMVETWLFDR